MDVNPEVWNRRSNTSICFLTEATTICLAEVTVRMQKSSQLLVLTLYVYSVIAYVDITITITNWVVRYHQYQVNRQWFQTISPSTIILTYYHGIT